MRTDADIIWTFFSRNPVTTKWEVKPHARQAFFEFMASWSIYVNDPKRYGWRQTLPDVPKPTYHEVEVPCTQEQRDWLQRLSADQKTGQMDMFGGGSALNAIQRTKLSQVAKGFVYVKGSDGKANKLYRDADPGRTLVGADGRAERIESNKAAVTARIVCDEANNGAQVLVWTVFDAESTLVKEAIERDAAMYGGCSSMEVLTGKTSEVERLRILEDFRSGKVRVLISRASMLGYGMNFQCCSAMVFSGWTDSFESLYQAVRRAYRHGQTESVRVYFPVVRELEGDMLENIQRKEFEFEKSIAEMEESYIRVLTNKQ